MYDRMRYLGLMLIGVTLIAGCAGSHASGGAATPSAATAGPGPRRVVPRTLVTFQRNGTLGAATRTDDDARHICRMCQPGVCGHPARCPVTQALV